MKFLCGSCRTKYQISDEKVRGKILTIRCKKCGAKIMVRESLTKEADGGTALAPVAEAANGGMRAGGSASIATAYEAEMGRDPQETPSDLPTSIAPVPVDAGLAGYEWYLAVDGQQHGPFAFAELVRKVRGGEVHGAHYAWHDGMDDWKRVREIADLAAYLPPSTAPRAVPPPPPADEPGADVLDFASRAKRSGPESDEHRAAPGPTSDAGPTQGGPPPPAAMVEALSSDLDSEDIFANVPRASEQELVQQESTRFFVQAAGVQEEHKRNRLGRIIGLVVGVLLATFVGLWASGVIKVFLPFIGNPFASTVETTAKTYDGTSDDDDAYDILIGKVGVVPAQERRRRRRPARRDRPKGDERVPVVPELGGESLPDIAAEDFVDTEETAGASRRGRRSGSAAPEVSIGGVGRKIDVRDHTRLIRLPTETEGLEVPPADTDVLTAGVIRRVVRSRQGSVRRCYEQSLRAKEGVEGKISVAVVVEPTGTVSDVELLSPAFAGTVVGTCIVKSLRNWRFPAFKGEAQEVELPFVFQKGR